MQTAEEYNKSSFEKAHKYFNDNDAKCLIYIGVSRDWKILPICSPTLTNEDRLQLLSKVMSMLLDQYDNGPSNNIYN